MSSAWEQVDELVSEVQDVRDALERRDERIADLERALDERADEVTRLRAERSALERENERLRERLEACSESLAAVLERCPASRRCVVCGSELTDPKNAGDPDVDGDWVCRSEHCRAVHDVEMEVDRDE